MPWRKWMFNVYCILLISPFAEHTWLSRALLTESLFFFGERREERKISLSLTIILLIMYSIQHRQQRVHISCVVREHGCVRPNQRRVLSLLISLCFVELTLCCHVCCQPAASCSAPSAERVARINTDEMRQLLPVTGNHRLRHESACRQTSRAHLSDKLR